MIKRGGTGAPASARAVKRNANGGREPDENIGLR